MFKGITKLGAKNWWLQALQRQSGPQICPGDVHKTERKKEGTEDEG